MTNNRLFGSIKILTALGLLLLAACSDKKTKVPQELDPLPQVKQFTVTTLNLTNNQPLSPLTVLLHTSGDLWTVNSPASVALETMAESGDNMQLLADPVAVAGVSGDGVIMPGMADEIVIETTITSEILMSLATMLVNTNDAFTGFSGMDVTYMAVGDSESYRFSAYDAGTEANSEMAGTIPGPADGGEGFNLARETNNFVTIHRGVVTQDDGYALSILNESHRFDNPVIQVNISRIR